MQLFSVLLFSSCTFFSNVLLFFLCVYFFRCSNAVYYSQSIVNGHKTCRRNPLPPPLTYACTYARIYKRLSVRWSVCLTSLLFMQFAVARHDHFFVVFL